MTKSFIIVISVIFVIQILTICSFIRFLPVAKAGKVSKFYWKYKMLLRKGSKVIECDGEKVDVSSYKVLYVYGNSMKDYSIHNGQEVFVSEYTTESQKMSIHDYPVLVFHIYDMGCQSPYKLRKFVGYVKDPGTMDWHNFYNQFKDRIKIKEAQFISECKNKQDKLNGDKGQYILSETYDEDMCTYRYSMHPVSSLYARVMYAV